jgi:hypothetical protein
MSEQPLDVKILALALYEIRLLLSPYLGQNSHPNDIRVAAHLAYALHNEALAVFEGTTFNPQAALAKVEAIDHIVKVDYSKKFLRNLKKP